MRALNRLLLISDLLEVIIATSWRALENESKHLYSFVLFAMIL